MIRLSQVSCRGLVACVPKNTKLNSDFGDVFTESEIAGFAKMTGINSRRICDAKTSTADLCAAAAEQLLSDLGWEKSSVDTLILVTQTPSYVLPATSCMLQDRLGLPKHCIAFDVNLGCSGYVYGQYLCQTLLANGGLKRAILLVGDTCSKFVAPKDRATTMLFGDAGSATAFEYDPGANESYFVLGTDGSGAENLIIPPGGFLEMKGAEIFSFTMEAVPKLVQDCGREIPDFYVFHQANQFILDNLCRKLKLDRDKVPMSIRDYGNTSCASIPVTLAHRLSKELTEKSLKLMLIGYGVGYSWAGCLTDWGPLKTVKLIEC